MTHPLPQNWQKDAFSNIQVRVVDGDRGTNYPKQGDFTQSGYCVFLNAGNVTKNGFDFSEIAFISKERDELLRKGKLNKGDLVITTRGTTGNIAFFSEEIDFEHIRINSGMAIIRNENPDICTKFLVYFFQSSASIREVERLSFGSAQPQLTIGIINKIAPPLPPLPEQQRIVTILETWDKAIQKLERKIELKKNVKKGLMQQLLTGKKRLPGFSGAWETVMLGDLAHIKTGKKDNKDKVENGEYPFFVRSPIIEKINSYSFDGEAILVPGEGNIGQIFHYINGKFDFHQRVYKISNFVKKAHGKYIYYFISNNFAKHAKQSSVKATVDSLRLPMFKEFEIQLPSLEEQQSISSILDSSIQEIELLQSKLQKLKDQKTYLLNHLITGRIRTPETMSLPS